MTSASRPGGVAPKFIAFILLLLISVRLLTLGAYPLGSTTEPRYAEIARKMLETGNWVTPWFDHGVPFWGKPPLSFWGSAATMAVLGVNEFAVRLPPFLAAMGTGALFWAWPRREAQRVTLPLAASVVLFSTVAGFIASAAVMTDMFMALGTTLCMVSFWLAVNEAQVPWRWGFFIGLAVGLLAKGPVATVITGLALFIWVAWAGTWGVTWQRLPWWRGALLTALLTLPWYLLAEHRTPGFLQYFIVGEHFQRFLVSGWTGDLYGQGHPVARGLIWWFGFGGFLPWTLVALLALGVLWRKPSAVSLQGQGEPAVALGHSLGRHAKEWQYLVAWTVAPLLFFTSARNILEAYVLPGLPAFALLATLLVFAAADRAPWMSRLWLLGLLCPLLWVGWLATSTQPELRSQRALLRQWDATTPLVYLGSRPLSANFYSHGKAQLAESPEAMRRWLATPTPVTLILQDTAAPALPAAALLPWHVVARHAGFTMLQRGNSSIDVPVGATIEAPVSQTSPKIPSKESK